MSAVDGEQPLAARGVMAQNHPTFQGIRREAARAYREWSQRNWQQVTDQRNASDEGKNYSRRENLGPSKAYSNPYDSSAPVELPQTYQHYWVNRQGTYVGTNDPSINPNDGSTGEWKKCRYTGRNKRANASPLDSKIAGAAPACIISV